MNTRAARAHALSCLCLDLAQAIEKFPSEETGSCGIVNRRLRRHLDKAHRHLIRSAEEAWSVQRRAAIAEALKDTAEEKVTR